MEGHNSEQEYNDGCKVFHFSSFDGKEGSVDRIFYRNVILCCDLFSRRQDHAPLKVHCMIDDWCM